ncbi:MmgE/PrpD family protein [Sulfitobacter sp. PR48]|uniref:MmgE/PrpD family protein n=1 Tax=Sulfitobacter sp. PR48 TaxID=3028383 RepID=UPI00237B3A7B|nr:MmgE/PrpD family protein [Sulfitobacter sp. PR48]MDD9723426.1 MmgE/PrpD family protein [Sulfitobacter sp. PR48]|tara:strand:- start:7566 stop:8948 length:1383 start_codon:yes stop_codon:yes gene_type:complete
MEITASHGALLSGFVADLEYDNLPESVVRMIRDLAVDWYGSAVAGHAARPVQALEAVCGTLVSGKSESTVLSSGNRASAYAAAMINAASSHVVEQDDVHNGAVFHPAAVVFPAVFALAEARNLNGPAIIEAAVCGYEVGIRVGEFLGRSHYVHFHTTGTAGTLACAAAVAKLLKLDARQVLHAFGTAGTQAAGLWEFLADAADSKQVHTAGATANGMFAAFLAQQGVTGAARIFDGPHGMAAALSQDADPARLSAGLGSRWATLEMSYKWHASCRHTHPAADALAEVLSREALLADDIEKVIALVHQGAIDVLGAVRVPESVHQAKFSMGTVLGLIAVHGKAGVLEFDSHALSDPAVAAFRDRVEMQFDPEVDVAYPSRWLGRVTVHTRDGRVLRGAIDDPKGDPGNPLGWDELLAKAESLCRYEIASNAAVDTRLAWLKRLEALPELSGAATLFRPVGG